VYSFQSNFDFSHLASLEWKKWTIFWILYNNELHNLHRLLNIFKLVISRNLKTSNSLIMYIRIKTKEMYIIFVDISPSFLVEAG
jgi:hypothetical protein